MRPASFQVVGDLFAVVWDDGHESYYPLEALRRACPCAACSGEPDLFGRMSSGPPAGMRANGAPLYGSVTSKDVVEALKAKGYEVDKKDIVLPDSVKDVGEYTVTVKLGSGIESKVKLVVKKK